MTELNSDATAVAVWNEVDKMMPEYQERKRVAPKGKVLASTYDCIACQPSAEILQLALAGALCEDKNHVIIRQQKRFGLRAFLERPKVVFALVFHHTAVKIPQKIHNRVDTVGQIIGLFHYCIGSGPVKKSLG
jgi:hypothetical protein